MATQNINEALGAVRQMRQVLLQKQPFRGYSGPARVLSGACALITAWCMASDFYPQTTRAHILGWGGVFLAASVMNTAAVLYWLLHDKVVRVDFRRLKPVLDTLPPLMVGAVLTFVFIFNGYHNLLFGVWMCMFGLSNLASRYVLPPWIAAVGIFYVMGGTLCLLSPSVSFLNPWPMGFIFFAGECAGGLILYADRRRYTTLEKTSEWFHFTENDHG